MYKRQANDAYARVFQYKILNNILYLNKKLFLFGLSDTSNCPFCNTENEDTVHLFHACTQTTALWHALKNALIDVLPLPDLSAKYSVLGFFDHARENCVLVNHLLLIYKIFVYRQRSSGFLSFDTLLNKIKDIAILEINVSKFSPQTNDRYLQK